MALKHGLPISHFAINHEGYFTEYCGDFKDKKAIDFADNIIQNLDDIHNLESTSEITHAVAMNKKGQKLEAILVSQRFLGHTKSEETLEADWNIQASKYTETIHHITNNINQTKRAISKQEPYGSILPVRADSKGNNYPIGEEQFLSLAASKKKNKKTISALLIYNMIMDQRLDPTFSIEQCIDALFARDEEENLSIGEMYLEAIIQDLPRGYASEIKEIQKLYEYMADEKSTNNIEKCSNQLVDILESTLAIQSLGEGEYIFDPKILSKSSESLLPSNEKIDSTIASSLLLIQESKQEKMQAETTVLMSNPSILHQSTKTIMMGRSLVGKSIDDMYIYPANQQISKDRRQEIMEKR